MDQLNGRATDRNRRRWGDWKSCTTIVVQGSAHVGISGAKPPKSVDDPPVVVWLFNAGKLEGGALLLSFSAALEARNLAGTKLVGIYERQTRPKLRQGYHRRKRPPDNAFKACASPRSRGNSRYMSPPFPTRRAPSE